MAITCPTRGANRSLLVLAGALLVLVPPFSVQAERPLALNQLDSEKQPSRPLSEGSHGLTADDEAAALTFVKEHHGELASLLRVLRTMNEPQYRNAIRDLTRTRMRLEQLRRRGEDRYELELQVWQAKSRIQLLTARLHMGDSPELRTELLAAFEKQAKLRREILETERARAAERLSRVEEQLDRLPSDPATEAKQQMNNLLAKLKESKRPPEKSQRPAKPATVRPSNL